MKSVCLSLEDSNMKNLHKKISFLPILIVWYWLFCAVFLSKTEFYSDNFEVLDKIDTLTVMVSVLHFIFFNQYYNAFKLNYLKCIYFIILINFMYFYIDEKTYYLIYYLVTSTFIIAPIWKTQTLK